MNVAATVVSLLTPAGRGALATIGVRGPDAWRFTNTCITPPIDGMMRPWLRDFHTVQGTSEELVVVFPNPSEARIHCHGGIAACEAVLQALEGQGAQRIDWQEWICHLEGEISVALAHALTERTALIVLDQQNGAWAKEINNIRELLNEPTPSAAIAPFDALLARESVGLHLTQPWQVVIAGRPNAGKSSLLNALLGFQRSITSSQPGTTRDVVTARTAIDGWPIELRDTAGLRAASDEIESAGVALAEQELRTADLVLYLIPADEAVQEAEAQLQMLRNRSELATRLMIVRTKADLAANESVAGDCLVSVHRNEGLGVLTAAIVQKLIPISPEPGTAVPWQESKVSRLREARNALVAGDQTAAADYLLFSTSGS